MMCHRYQTGLATACFILGWWAAPANATLTFHPFKPFVPCADGSPAGIYAEENPTVEIASSQNHVIVFIGGGACTSPEDCVDGYNMEPFKFTTKLNPPQIEGDTILSRDPKINPMHAHTKWLVPYCSQDFFLGDANKGKIGEFTHSGSTIFDGALTFWKNRVLAATKSLENSTSTHPLDSVVAVGLSAGAIGVMNKMDKIREAVNEVGAQNLRIILDSSTVLSDVPYLDKDFRAAMTTYVNLSENPLCDPRHYYSRLYTAVSALPCCLSPHCMLRHDTRLFSLFQPRQNSTRLSTGAAAAAEELLMLDSVYDIFALVAGSSFDEGGDSESNSARSGVNDMWSMVEIAGSRKTRALETNAAVKVAAAAALDTQNLQYSTEVTNELRVNWIFTSCVTHTFMNSFSSAASMGTTRTRISTLPVAKMVLLLNSKSKRSR
jgi:hypothetical protein